VNREGLARRRHDLDFTPTAVGVSKQQGHRVLGGRGRRLGRLGQQQLDRALGLVGWRR
jgi:hypothetical protein